MPKRPTMTETRIRTRVHDVSFGAWCYEHKWWILGTWVIALVLLVALGTLWGGKPRDNYTIPAGESRVALDILERTSLRRVRRAPRSCSAWRTARWRTRRSVRA